MSALSLTSLFQERFEESCSTWKSLFTVIVSHIEPIEDENRRLRSQIEQILHTQSSIQRQLQAIQSSSNHSNNRILIAETLPSSHANASQPRNTSNDDALAATLPSSQYIAETHPNDNDDDETLTLMQTDDDDDDDDIRAKKGEIHIDRTLSMKTVSPSKPPSLEVGTLAFPDDLVATQMEDNHNGDQNAADLFYLGFGVDTEPTESQAILGFNMNHNNIESATQLMDELSSDPRNNGYNKAHNHCNDERDLPTQIIPNTELISDVDDLQSTASSVSCCTSNNSRKRKPMRLDNDAPMPRKKMRVSMNDFDKATLCLQQKYAEIKTEYDRLASNRLWYEPEIVTRFSKQYNKYVKECHNALHKMR
eukprot:144837_1